MLLLRDESRLFIMAPTLIGAGSQSKRTIIRLKAPADAEPRRNGNARRHLVYGSVFDNEVEKIAKSPHLWNLC